MEQMLRALSRVVLADRAVDDVLAEVVGIAEGCVPGSDAASITLLRADRAFTVAATNELARAADELQYRERYGPCLDAARGGVVLRVDDMTTEQRWPSYTPRTAAIGVCSSLSVPLPYLGEAIGALNVYSARSAAFTAAESLSAATDVAEAVAVVVANAEAHHEVGERARNMRIAMESRAVIEQAKGVLMAQRSVDAEQAFEILREASQRSNRKLRDIAVGVVASTQPAAQRSAD